MNFNQVNLEKDYIGCLLIDIANYKLYPLSLDDFQTDPAKKIFKIIQQLLKEKKEASYHTVGLSIGNDISEWLEDSYSDGFPRNIKFSYEEIKNNSKKKRLQRDLANILNGVDTFGLDSTIQDIKNIYLKAITDHNEDYSIDKSFKRLDKHIEKNIARGYIGIETGYEWFKDNYVTYQEGHLWVVGAWTSIGKSAYMIDSNIKASLKSNPKTLIFSLEMKEHELRARQIANLSGVHSKVIESGSPHESLVPKINEARKTVEGFNTKIIDNVRDMSEIERICHREKIKNGLDVVYIDFIQNVKKKGYSKRYEMMADIAIDVQNLANELAITLICLSQIPNSAGKEDGGILEFKNAGEIAAACDVGILLSSAKNAEGVLLVDVRKNRHGKKGRFLLEYVKNYTSFNETGGQK